MFTDDFYAKDIFYLILYMKDSIRTLASVLSGTIKASSVETISNESFSSCFHNDTCQVLRPDI